nr:hypothetical protein [Tanacetum cinerariifolium]
MEQQNPTLVKIPILDTGKFEQWQFQIQQYLQHEHYALWEVIEFRDSYEAPADNSTIGSVRTTLLLSLPDEHQLRFSKYKTTQELWVVILKTFGGNEATKKTKKNLLKQQYGNFKAGGSETLEQTFNRLQDINLIYEDDMEEMDIKWNMALLSMRADRAPKSQDRGRRDNYRQGSKVKEQAPKALMAIDGVGWNWSYMANDEEKSCIKLLKKEKGELETKLIGFQTVSKDLDSLLESQRLDKNKEGLGYSVVPPPAAQVYSPLKKDMSWTGLPEFKDDTANNSPTKSKTSKVETANKPPVKYAEQYRKPTKKPDVKVRSQYRAPWVPTVNRKFSSVNRKFSTVGRNFSTVNRKSPTANRKFPTGGTKFSTADMGKKGKAGSSHNNIDDKGYWDSGCSRHMTGNISYLSDYEPFDEGYVSFSQGGCNITGKGTIKTGKLEFENVYFVKDLKYNLFSVSQISNNKNSVLFTDSECIVLGRDFKLLDDANVLLRTPRQHNMYSIDLNNIVPHKDLTCLVAKASADEGMLWHRRLGHLNFKTMNKLVRQNLVKGLPTKCFENNHTYTAFLKGKQHKASWIKREFSNARTPQQNGVAERRNRTLIEAARTMLADAKLLVTFWAEAVNTACYVQNKVLVNKSQNKTLYELFNGRTPAIGFLKPFGCHVMILNTLDNLGKFEAKGDKGTNSTNLSGIKDASSQEVKKDVSYLRYIALPNWVHDALLESSSSKPQDDCSTDVPESSGNSNLTTTSTNPSVDQMETLTVETPIPTVSLPVLTACFTDSQEPSSDTRLISKRVANQVETPSLDNILTLTNQFKDILGFTTNSDESNGVKPDVSNMETTITASPTPTLRIHKDHLKSQIISPVDTPIQTRNKSKENVWTLVDWPKGVRPIGTKWVLKNKKDKRGIVIRNKARLVAQGHTQEEGIDYDEVFAPLARIEAIRLFLAYASFMGFTVNQMDVKSAFLYGTIDEEVYVMQPLRFQDPEFPAKVYKVEKAMYGLHQAPRAWLSMPCEALSREISSSILCLSDSEQRTHKFIHVYLASAIIMARLAFYDYHNMVAILEKSEHNVDFHPIVDFIEASPLRYALTFKPTVYVSHIRQFWSTARIKTTEEGAKILATIDGNLRTVSESSIRRNLKLNDEAGISSLLDAELFENLTLIKGEACPTDSGFKVDQDRANIAKSSILSNDLAPRVTSLAVDEGSMQQKLDELTALWEEVAKRVSDDTEETVTVLTSMDAATVLSSRAAKVPTGSGSILTDGPPTAKVPTGSDVVPTAGPISTTATVVGWKAKDFKGMTLEEIKENLDQVWKQINDFIPIGSKEEAKRFKRKGIRFEQESVKKLKTLEEVKATVEVPEEESKGDDVAVKESLSIRLPTNDKEIELWVELKKLYEPDDEDQLWTHTQNLMHAPVEWKLYDTCGVHHVTSKDKEIFMLVEKDYPLRKGQAIVMISYKLQVENYSQMANDLILKIYKITNCPRKQDD